MVNSQGSASSACRSQAVDGSRREAAARFLLDARWTGLFMLEFLRDTSGDAWLMELNGRPWGSMALARRRGLEYPAWAVRVALDPGFVPAVPADPRSIVCRHLGLELAHLAFVVRGPQSKAAEAWPSLWRTLLE